ncbi:carbamoyl-phosphate synthase subunit L [Leptospira wolffii]|uniref:carboxyl transferase domain-containing protein n=1 Tax=Leptospira wolffii TaxID=409998 RepID=UPI001082C826|nr:carboxyl transferase domain-containing protein [Leptospira wolffii]TGK62188.1 carbamoyl-phosphate synthase subunit L [Leptospira wolffii]TGK66559.1 carbamoyl-phosphate synthase subunit L [Leptospira wolffii]TGK74428.1 carbamoyl-phosphate synthase subunit L [Leptospira wolffii]TGL31997.1 carbamoyl-phosphate synthase subunit L [Leptospira wolffii]
MIPIRKPEPESLIEGNISLPEIDAIIRDLKILNPNRKEGYESVADRKGKLKKVLVANRGEIAKRFFLALREEGIRSVAVVTNPDKEQSWYESADEIVYVGESDRYSDAKTIVAAVLLSGADAVYPGYGFLSEDYRFVESLEAASSIYNKNIIFMGPKASVMRKVGNKLDARKLALENGIPLFKGSGPVSGDQETILQEAEKVGYPLIIKLDSGGGGKGMVVVRNRNDLLPAVESAVRIGIQSYGNATYFFEKFVERPAHFEVQIFSSTAVGIRKCAVQRRNQKVVEESGETFLDDRTLLQLLSSAEKIAHISGYSGGCGAGTVEFLLDNETGNFGFLEMNTRLQVEYPVTDQSLGIDLAKWQILLFDGREQEIPYDSVVRKRFSDRNHSIQCRIYAEDPFQNYSPSPGKIKDLELPTFNGVRCDFGFRKGDRVLGDYDPMIGKLITTGTNREESLLRMERALSDLYVRGITTNIEQLIGLIRHELFRKGNYDNRILLDHPELTRSDSESEEEAALYCSLAECLRITENDRIESLRGRDLAKLLHSQESEYSDYQFELKSETVNFQTKLFRLSTNSYQILLNGKDYGKIGILSKGESGEEFLAEYRGRTVPVRIDRRPSFHSIRFPDGTGKLRYSRFSVHSKDKRSDSDSAGFLRSPFQGTFVKICEDPNTKIAWTEGSPIQEGDPILIIAAMKMETVLCAPSSGTLTFLAEHGDLGKLVRGVTASGMVLGKGFAEGEILAKIESVVSDSKTSDFTEKSALPESLWESLSILEPESDAKTVFPKSVQNPQELRKLLRSWSLGTLREQDTATKIDSLLKTFHFNNGSDSENKSWGNFYIEILKFHVLVRRIFSSDPGTKFSHYGEIHRLLTQWDTEGYNPPKTTKKLLSNAFHYYGVKSWNPLRRTKDQEEAFLFLVRAYANLREGKEVFAKMLELLSVYAPPTPSVDLALNGILFLEEREKETSLEKTVRRILAARGNRPQKFKGGDATISREHVFDYIRFVKNPWSLVSEEAMERLEFLFLDSFGNPLPLIPEGISESLSSKIRRKLEYWQEKGNIKRLFSPAKGHYLYIMEKENENEYILFSVLLSDPGHKISRFDLETVAKNGSCILQGAQALRKADIFRFEVLVSETPVEFDLGSEDEEVFNYNNIMESAGSVVRFFLHGLYSQFTMDFLSKDTEEIVTLSFFFKEGKLRMDVVYPGDPKFPYGNHSDPKDKALFQKGKWPLESWADLVFDRNSVREILVKGADGILKRNPKTGLDEEHKPGAKIYSGKIGGKSAVCFFKDSRVAGGATGDLEGRKYIAAAYYAYRKDVPLYVWNDGAGANIKEGMVSLNRAAEGFFMNSLLTSRSEVSEFRAAIESHPDAILRQICSDIEKEYGSEFRVYSSGEKPENCFVVAVGIGSSTGLDVYGSSQASLQIILNEEESYRVLTGSSVIESVTGEKFTNFEIGGARIMGQATGTADFVANDKVQLIWYLRRIQDSLLGSHISKTEPQHNSPREEWCVLDENEILRNSDSKTFLAIKENYSGSGSLVTGLTRFGDSPVLVMGPRTSYGFHSLPCIIKAKESLKIAEKTGSNLLLVYGNKWFRSSHLDDSDSLRPRRDFQKELQKFNGIRLHMVKNPDGLRIPELAAGGDAWLLVEGEDRKSVVSKRILENARRWATFTAPNEKSAYETVAKFFHLMEKREIGNSETNNSPISLPSEISSSYDMKEEIVLKIFDPNSFLEFFPWDPGSSLITGLGRIRGKTVAVIADQPKGGGSPDAPGTEKFRVFTEFVEKHGIPLLMLSDAPGFVPGTKQERLRIQQIGGESLDVNVLSKIPVLSLVLRQNYGGRQIHAFSGFLRPGIAYYSLADATLAVMGSNSAFDLFQGAKVSALRKEGKEEEIEILRNEFFDDFRKKSRADADAKSSGVLDGVFSSISDLREIVESGLKEAERKTEAWRSLREKYSRGPIYTTSGNSEEEWKDLILP